MNKIAYTNENGQLCIIIPTAKESLEKVLGSLTDEEYRNHVMDRNQAHLSLADDVTEITDDMMPSSREYRDAWFLKDGKIVIDSDKAAKIDKQRTKVAEFFNQFKLEG